jgi:hypothetical protein
VVILQHCTTPLLVLLMALMAEIEINRYVYIPGRLSFTWYSILTQPMALASMFKESQLMQPTNVVIEIMIAYLIASVIEIVCFLYLEPVRLLVFSNL